MSPFVRGCCCGMWHVAPFSFDWHAILISNAARSSVLCWRRSHLEHPSPHTARVTAHARPCRSHVPHGYGTTEAG
eukprot:1835112-Prymnesium_polylepis.1